MPIFEKKCPNSNQIRAARWLLGLGQKELAETIKVSLSSLRRYEGLRSDENPYDYLRASIVERIKGGFQLMGVEFLNNESSMGVVLKTEQMANDGK